MNKGSRVHAQKALRPSGDSNTNRQSQLSHSRQTKLQTLAVKPSIRNGKQAVFFCHV